jgi:hypothetical protein
MIDTLRRAAMTRRMVRASMTAAIVMIASPAFAQAPTEAQRAAIKSSCRSDYIAHCSSVPPGGMESLQCLQKNMSSLSSSCQTAVRAVAVTAPAETKAEPNAEPKETPKETAKETTTETTKETTKEAPKAETKAEPVPAAAPTKPAAESAGTVAPKAAASASAMKPSSAQIAAVRSACRSDYPRVCAGVPTGGAAALQCLEKSKSKVSAGCEKAVAAVSAAVPAAGGAPAAQATASPTAAPAAPAASALVLRPMRPREILFVLRSACSADVRALCAGVDPGGGRILECLAAQSASLSPDCRGVLSRFAAR